MTAANKITFFRIALTPVLFFVAYYSFIEKLFDGLWVTYLILFLFLICELTDLVDGYVARRSQQVSDLGKLLDPFSDVFLRISYFVLFLQAGFMPMIAFIFILWREISIYLLRMIMLRMGIVMAARWSGKIKAVMYFLSGIYGILVLTQIIPAIAYLNIVLFYLAALFSVISLFDYIKVVVQELKNNDKISF